MPTLSNQNPIPIIPKKDKFTFPISFADGVENDGSKPAERATKNNIFAQNAVPTGDNAVGDLWFDTDDSNKIYRWSGTAWVSVKDGTILVGATTTFFQASIPTSLAVGDLWIDSDDGNKIYRAASVGADQITAGEWVLVEMTAGITTFAQDAIPTSLAIGDLWVDTNDGNKLYRAASVGADQITAGEWVEVPPDFANIGGSTKPADNATVGAVAGTNLKDSLANVLYDEDIIRLLEMVYGDGSDGDVTISDGGTTTLSSNAYYNNLTITNNSILNPGGWQIFVKGTLTIASGSKIARNGSTGGNGGNAGGATGGTAGTAGAALSAGYYPACQAGTAGVAGADAPAAGTISQPGNNGAGGNTGANVANSAGEDGQTGGNGGDGGDCPSNAGGTKGTGGAGGTATPGTIKPKDIVSILQWVDFSDLGTLVKYNGSASPGSGGSGASGGRWYNGGGSGNIYAGGGGGSGGTGSCGGIVGIFAREVVNNGAISANGGVGGTGGTGGTGSIASQPSFRNCAGGGGGGAGGTGGTGGVLILIYNKYSGSGTKTASGGTGGTLGAGGNKVGDDGQNGDPGTTANGAGGVLIELQN